MVAIDSTRDVISRDAPHGMPCFVGFDEPLSVNRYCAYVDERRIVINGFVIFDDRRVERRPDRMKIPVSHGENKSEKRWLKSKKLCL